MREWASGLLERSPCPHLPESAPDPVSDACKECGQRFSLRMCGTCGHVGCCETSRGHARDHARAANRPIIYSMPVGRGFAQCYVEHRYVD
ncbi:MAG: UBP-type zinc finger domain-containing protein [Candidatus Limnocylindria bacterium]